MSPTSPLSLGVIADAQYADLPDGNTEGRTQRYREVPDKLRNALAALRAHEPLLAAVLHLGDTINGNELAGQAACDAEFELVAAIFDEQLGEEVPAVHVIGNHCLSVPRATLLQRLRIPGCYYSRSLGAGWRLVVLDTTELSGCSGGYPPGSWQAQEAEVGLGSGQDSLPLVPASASGRLCAQPEAPPPRFMQAFLTAQPMSDANPQMSSWNGGISQRQLAWLCDELSAAEAAGERVIACSHHQVGRGAARATHMAWNWRDVQQALLASPAFRLALAGHDHMGGYACIDGRHFVTLEALLEAPRGGTAYAVLHVHPDVLVIEGHGSVTSRRLPV